MGIIYEAAELVKIAIEVAIEKDIDLKLANIPEEIIKETWIEANVRYDKKIRDGGELW